MLNHGERHRQPGWILLESIHHILNDLRLIIRGRIRVSETAGKETFVALSQETVQSLIDYAASDPDFLQDLVQDPETAVEARGIALQSGELDQLQGLLDSSHGSEGGAVEELQARISHSLLGHDDLSRLLLMEHFLRSAGGEE
jgi:hypothetical protein